MKHATSNHALRSPLAFTRVRAAGVMAAFCIATTGLAGCGGASWPRDIKIAPDQMYEVDAKTISKTISLPADRAFNVHDHRSEQNPGQDGTAQGASEATKQGSAFCKAEAADGGSASADFMIGHVFHTPTGQSADAVAHIELKIQQEQTISPPADADTLADYACDVFVRDSNDHVVRKVALVAASTVEGPAATSEAAIFDVPFTLEPSKAYYVVVAGRVSAKSTAGHNASASVTIQDMKMQVRFAPAAAKPKADEAKNAKAGDAQLETDHDAS